MNTKEAVARYGLWATIAGFMMWSTDHLSPPHNDFQKEWGSAKHYTNRWLQMSNSDTDYHHEALNAIAARARSRPK